MPKRQPIVRPLLLATILALGFGIIWGVAAAWFLEIAEGYFGPKHPVEGYQIRSDGTPVISSYWGNDYINRTYRTLEGQPLSPAESEKLRLHDNRGGAFLVGPDDTRGPFRGLEWQQRLIKFDDHGQPVTHWYFVHDGQLQGSAYFVGYDSQSKLCVGYIGTQGWRSELPPEEEWFPIDGRLIQSGAISSSLEYTYPLKSFREAAQFEVVDTSSNRRRKLAWSVYMLTDDGLVLCDFRERRPFLAVPSTGISAFAPFLQAEAEWKEDTGKLPPTRSPSWMAIRKPREVVLLNLRGPERRTYTIPGEWQSDHFSFYERPDKTGLATRQRLSRGMVENSLVWFDAAGKVLGTHALDPRPMGWSHLPGTRVRVGALKVPVPLAGAIRLNTGLADEYLRTGEAASYTEAVTKAWQEALPVAVVLVIVSALLAAVACRRQRAYSLPWTAVWAAFVFLGGIPGFLAYRFHRRWAVCEACPSCGHVVPRDRQSCAHCRTEFPRPAPKGIEVFA